MVKAFKNKDGRRFELCPTCRHYRPVDEQPGSYSNTIEILIFSVAFVVFAALAVVQLVQP